jgi:hypothetical protein
VSVAGWVKDRWHRANDLDWPWWMALGIAAAAVVAPRFCAHRRQFRAAG